MLVIHFDRPALKCVELRCDKCGELITDAQDAEVLLKQGPSPNEHRVLGISHIKHQLEGKEITGRSSLNEALFMLSQTLNFRLAEGKDGLTETAVMMDVIGLL